ncbi:MAG: ATP-binding cassette domain-containing protein [Acidimicrobiia bacterium]|nr:ATP-binding cassette domain-containing protein [Acidimicrobiia bacterium]
MGHIAVSNLGYAHPGGSMLFTDVSFSLSPGAHAGLIGINGVGKTTLLRILAGELDASDGDANLGGQVRYMAQDVGVADAGGAGGSATTTVREMMIDCSPEPLRSVGRRLLAAEAAATPGTDADAAMELAEAIGQWSDCGGYLAEASWDATLSRVVRSNLDEAGARLTTQLSGGERKQIVLDLLFNSDADVLLLDEPDNYLDVPAKQWLEDLINTSSKTVLMVSHDRQLLSTATSTIVTLEAFGAWVHGRSYASYPEARAARQRQLGDARQRWKDEERRLYRFYKIMKQRASISDVMAPRANAAESRWERFVAAGPPPPPAPDQKVKMRLRGGDSGRRVVGLESVELPDLVFPFSDEVFFGERLGLIGPNGSGKTHLLRLLVGEPVEHSGTVKLGARVAAGLFTQVNDNPDLTGGTVMDPVMRRLGNHEKAMQALARYGLASAVAGVNAQSYETLSGGQKARLEILCLELDGHNLLLLDEPTDNLDIDSAEALEMALDTFEGTVIAVSHDRAFLSRFDRYWMVGHDGFVHALPDWETASEVLAAPATVDVLGGGRTRLAKLLTVI